MIVIITIMTDELALARLMAWLSPVFPTGGFAYSSGLETAMTSGAVCDEETLKQWLNVSLSHGRLINDAIFLKESVFAWDDRERFAEIGELALASAGSDELYLEATAQGAAFVEAMESWPTFSVARTMQPVALPVAVGAACGAASIDSLSATTAYLHAFITNQLQIAIRLAVIGQKACADLLAQLEPTIVALAQNSETKTLDDLGSAAIMADIAAMRHQTQHARMFRS